MFGTSDAMIMCYAQDSFVPVACHPLKAKKHPIELDGLV
jgi:hypothetical protein